PMSKWSGPACRGWQTMPPISSLIRLRTKGKSDRTRNLSCGRPRDHKTCYPPPLAMTTESAKYASASLAPDRPQDRMRPYRILVASSLVVPVLLFVAVARHAYQEALREVRQEVSRTTEVLHQHALNVFETHQ